MENNLVADRDGVIAKLLIGEGDVMATNQPIIQFAGGAAAAPKAGKVIKTVGADGNYKVEIGRAHV